MTHKSINFLPTKTKPALGELMSDLSTISPFPPSILGLTSSSSTQSFQKTLEGQSARILRERVAALHNPPSPASLRSTIAADIDNTKTVEERLFDATAGVKILTSNVAMYLDKEWRNRLFQQLDSLHDPEEWEPEDKPIQQASFSTFLKAIFLVKPTVRPGLGLSHAGYLVAAWTSGKNRLTIEFMPNDRVRWVVSRYPDGEIEQFAGQTQVSRLLDSLRPHSPQEWLFEC